MLHRAYVGVGANLGDAAATVRRAIAELSKCGRLERISPLYRTKPWGVVDQPDFVNAVVLLETRLEPAALLVALKALERHLGRTDGERWGPRVIDLDILTFDDMEIDDDDLVVPHPQLRERAFVLVPLAEIDPDYVPLRDALDARERDGVRRL